MRPLFFDFNEFMYETSVQVYACTDDAFSRMYTS